MSKNVTYEHFTDPQGGGCPMYCDVDQLFDADITQANGGTVWARDDTDGVRVRFVPATFVITPPPP